MGPGLYVSHTPILQTKAKCFGICICACVLYSQLNDLQIPQYKLIILPIYTRAFSGVHTESTKCTCLIPKWANWLATSESRQKRGKKQTVIKVNVRARVPRRNVNNLWPSASAGSESGPESGLMRHKRMQGHNSNRNQIQYLPNRIFPMKLVISPWGKALF